MNIKELNMPGIGALIAVVVIILCILGAIAVVPFTPIVVFCLVGALAIALAVGAWR